ncbi:hypothetical protein [Salinilacihabitans rarus]|uniref:hypothetical protein n=1 Tax=Salinilacihabitans rarus TaxID=2961596 RepID=UPI0020C8E87D|nr:hypothetical protein [Salinilacihabitans rarus]
MTDTEPSSDNGTHSGEPERFDVLRYSDEIYRDPYRVVPEGYGHQVVETRELQARQHRLLESLTVAILPPIASVIAVFGYSYPLWPLAGGGLVTGGIAGVIRYLYRDHRHRVPEVVVSGASTRVVRGYVDDFDPGDVSPPLVGEAYTAR